MKAAGAIVFILLAGLISLIAQPFIGNIKPHQPPKIEASVHALSEASWPVDEPAPAENTAQEALSELLRQHLLTPGNIHQWLNSFWATCQILSACLQDAQMLENQLSAEELLKLSDWLVAYDQYLTEMTSLTLTSEVSLQERRNRLLELREKHFDTDTALIFGVEHQFIALQNELISFWQWVPEGEATRETLNRFITLQHEAVKQMGDYSSELLSADTLYQQALPLLTELTNTEKEFWNRELLKHYFPSQWPEIEQWQQQQKQQSIKQAHYLFKRDQVIQKWQALQGQVPEADWHSGFEQELNELRQAHFQATSTD